MWVIYILDVCMYVVPMERAWKDEFNHTKYSKSLKINLQGFENKAPYVNHTPLNRAISQNKTIST